MVRIVFEKINRILVRQAGLTRDEHCCRKHVHLKLVADFKCGRESIPLLAQGISDVIEGWL